MVASEPAPPPGAPNVLLVVLDDVGYAQLGCYGSDIETPVIDGLAAGGVRLANFHTTALCSPTRACLLTGRNHHRSGMGRVADLAIGYPGYWGKPPRENGYLSEILRAAGYATYAVGKWHLSPEDETNMAASRATWPLARGFDRWYGFHGGETHQFVPALYHDNHSVRPPASIAGRLPPHRGPGRPRDRVPRRTCARSTPASRSSCTWRPAPATPRTSRRRAGASATAGGSTSAGTPGASRRSPASFPAAWSRRRRRCPRGPDWVPAWDSSPTRERAVAARFMECFAGFLSHADEQIGRVLGFLADTGDLDNTIVVVVSDNGASAEGGATGSINDVRMLNLDPAPGEEMFARLDEIGGPLTHNNYPWGWTMAGNTPFRRWKREVHEGGVADPCIVSWAARSLDGGAIRGPVHARHRRRPDAARARGARAARPRSTAWRSRGRRRELRLPARRRGRAAPPSGTPRSTSRCSARGPSTTSGWKAVTFHPVGPLYDDQDPNAPFGEDVWELYHVAEDLSETRDLAAQQPGAAGRLIELWWAEAERNQVLPLDNRVLWALVHPKPDRRPTARGVPLLPGAAQVPESVAVNVRNRSHALIVDVTIPESAASRRRAAGARVRARRLVAAHPRRPAPLRAQPVRQGAAHHRVGRAGPARRAPHRVRLHQGRGPGRHRRAALRRAGGRAGAIPRFTPSGFNGVGAGLTCGYEWGPAVGAGYTAPFPFGGTIRRAYVESAARSSATRWPSSRPSFPSSDLAPLTAADADEPSDQGSLVRSGKERMPLSR